MENKMLKIPWKEVKGLIEAHYRINDMKLMKSRGNDPDSEVYDMPEYVEGEVDE